MRTFRQIGIVGAVVLTPVGLFAHETGGRSAESVWSFEPAVVVPLAIVAVAFVLGAVRRWNRLDWSSAQAVFFAAGWLTLFVALVTPVHALGSLLFWVHMTQHELLMIVAAPLLVLSRPLLWFLWALLQRYRETLGSFAKRRSVVVMWSLATLPLFVWLLHGATLWAWHIPSLYDASVEVEWVHAVQHAMFLGTALLFWWTLLHGRHGRLTSGAGVVYCFTTAVHTSVLGALMTFAQRSWYSVYEGRTTAFHLTTLQDQQIGGLVMWVPAGVIFIGLGLWLMAAWIRESERRVGYSRVEQLVTGRHGA